MAGSNFRILSVICLDVLDDRIQAWVRVASLGGW
jgi:hypothetical protein